MQNAYELAQLSVQPSSNVPDEKASSTSVTSDQGMAKAEANTKDTTAVTKAASVELAFRSKGKSTPLLPSIETYDGLLACLEECSLQVDGKIFVIKRVQVADCGGQSQFHQILPIFVKYTTLYIFVCKLNEALSTHPMVKYNVAGKEICDPYRSSESYEQILEHSLRVIRSEKAKGDGKGSHLIIVGTHKDKESECTTETRESKNKRLAEMLLPEFKGEVKYYRQRPSKEFIFPLNAQFPGEEEEKIAAEIRRLISVECEAEAVDIPLQWHALEALLEDLTKAFGRDVISKEECFAAAKDLHFEDESALNAALQYLDQLNLIYYYPDILPGVVFASAQVLLDKVTELVLAVHELQDGKTATAMSRLQDEKWQRFCDHALVSADFLAQELFQRHYVPGVFNHINLMDLFKELLIFARFSSTEVLVPAILKKLTKQELDKYRICCSSSSSSTSCSLEHASPLVLSFPKHGGPLLGVFCATVVALLSEDNAQPNQWALKMEEDEVTPSCLFQNCVQFEIEDHPGSVTLIDSFEHIEVHISEAAATMEGFPASIKHAVIERIRKATLALHYNYSKPDFGFGCPCNSRPGFHLAKLGKSSRWICSKNKEKCGALSSCHKVWLEELESPQKATTTVESHHNRSPKEIDSPSLDSTLKQPTSFNIEPHQQQKQSTPEQDQLSPVSKTVDTRKKDSSLDIDSTPKLHELDLIEYNNKQLKLIDRVAYKWEDIAIRLHFEGHSISEINRDSHFQARPACQKMFIKWTQGVGRKPTTWKTLITALKEAGLGEVADELHKVINKTYD